MERASWFLLGAALTVSACAGDPGPGGADGGPDGLADASPPDARCMGIYWEIELSGDIPDGAEVVAEVDGGDLILREEGAATLGCGTPSAPCATIKVFAGGLAGDFDVTIEMEEFDAIGSASAGAFVRTSDLQAAEAFFDQSAVGEQVDRRIYSLPPEVDGTVPNFATTATSASFRFQRIGEEITVTSAAPDGEVTASGPFERAPATVGMTLLALDAEGTPGSSVRFPRLTVEQGSGLASDEFDCNTFPPAP